MSNQSQQLMTPELLKVALPKNLHSNATQGFADVINQLALDPETCEEVRGNFLTYSKVLQEGKWKVPDYLNAVVYVTHKLMGYSNQDSYIRAFPDRYQALVARGATAKDISAYVAAYHKNKLVNAILEQSLIPTHLLYQDAFHSAIQVQMRLMTSAASEKVQQEAANSLLTHLKAPEIKKVELDVNVKQHGGIEDLRATMAELAQNQKTLIENGQASASEMARAPIKRLSAEDKAQAIDVESTRIEPMAAAEVDPASAAGEDEPDLVDALKAGGFEVAFEIPAREPAETHPEFGCHTATPVGGGPRPTLEAAVKHQAAVEPPALPQAPAEDDISTWTPSGMRSGKAVPHKPRPSLFGFEPEEQ